MRAMRRRDLLLGLAAAALVGAGAWSLMSGGAMGRRNAALVAAVDRAGLRDATYARVVSAAAAEAGRDIGGADSVVVSVEGFRPGAVNLLLVDAELAAQRLAGVVPESDLALLRAARRNAVARPPDLIVVDRALAAELMVGIHNDLIGLANLLGAEVEDPAAQARLAGTMGTVATYLQLANLHAARVAGEPLVDTLGPKAAEAWWRLPPDAFTDPGELLSLGFLPVLAHEIGHLRAGTDGGYAPAEGLFARLTGARRGEEEADSFAAAAVGRAVARVRAESGGRVDMRAAVRGQSLAVLVKYLTDVLTVQAFGGFRGLRAEQLVTEVDHYNCGEEEDWRTSIPLGRHSVRHAQPRALPLLRRAEHDSLRARIHVDPARRTHADHAARAERLASTAMRGLGIDYTGRSRHMMGLLRSFDDGTPWVDDDLPAMPLTRARVAEGLGPAVRWEPAVGCARAVCEVAVLPEGGGYLELIHRDGRVLSIRAVLRFGAVVTEADRQRRATYALLITNLLMLSLDDLERFGGGALRALRTCGVVSADIPAEGYVVSLRTVVPGEWLALSAAAG